MNICVIIPVFNESKTVKFLVEEIKRKGLDVLVIDDGSTDNSGSIARAAGGHVIAHDQKKGKGVSLRDGFHYSLAHDYFGVITMDGDGQHAIEDIDKFIQEAKDKGPCIINGNRMNNAEKMPSGRYLTNKFMSGLISFFSQQNIPDSQCGYKYISCEVLRKIDLKCNDFEIETEILMKASKRKFKVFSMDIKTIYGSEKSKINPFKDTLRFISYFIKEIKFF